MGNKQLYEKQSNQYNPFFPIVRLEDIIETISDKSIQWILNNYNHIYVEYSESVAITRNKVPSLLRRNGLWISYNTGKDIVTEWYQGKNVNINDYNQWTNDANWAKFEPLADGKVTYQHLSHALKQLMGKGNNITNFPDEEDITTNGTVLSFKDRGYDTNNFSGLGKIILRKNIVLDDEVYKNILTQDMINKSNTIYEIRYDFDLDNKEITVPEGCILDFQGGSFRNGIIVGNGTKVNSIKRCFGLNIKLINFIEIEVDWYVDDDLTDFFQSLSTENTIVHLSPKTYYLNKGGIVLPKNVTIKGSDVNRTFVHIGEDVRDKYIFSFVYGNQFKDFSIRLIPNYECEIIRLSNDFITESDGTNPKWALENLDIRTRWVSSDTVYNATAIAIYCRDVDDDGNVLTHRSLSYLRNFKNLYLQYFNIGVDINISKKTDEGSKVWCNSFLFDNIVIWANIGIRFISENVDSDTGYFTFSNYMYQGGKNTYGYYTNHGRYNILVNYIPWDTDYAGYIENGQIFVRNMIKAAKNGNENYGFEGEGKVLSGITDTALNIRSSSYNGSTGTGLSCIMAGNNSLIFKPDRTRKNEIEFSNPYQQKFEAKEMLRNLNGHIVAAKTYKQLDNGTSLISSGGQVVEYVELKDLSTGRTTEVLNTAIPFISTNNNVLFYPNNTIVVDARCDKTLAPNSRYRINFAFKDYNGEEVDIYVSNTIRVYIESSIDTSHSSIGNILILNGVCGRTGGYVEVQTDEREVNFIRFKFTIINLSTTIALPLIKTIEFNDAIQYREFVSTRFLGHVGDTHSPTPGLQVYRTDYGKPFWTKDNTSKWYDANGNLYNIKTQGTTSERPTEAVFGTMYFDTTLAKPIWSKGDGTWIDATGAEV